MRYHPGNAGLKRWIVEARNRIEKEGDLETHSYVRAEIVASYLDEGPRIEVPASLFQEPEALLRTIPTGSVGEHIWRNGVLRLQRRALGLRIGPATCRAFQNAATLQLGGNAKDAAAE
jgi:hypothetical protein